MEVVFGENEQRGTSPDDLQAQADRLGFVHWGRAAGGNRPSPRSLTRFLCCLPAGALT